MTSTRGNPFSLLAILIAVAVALIIGAPVAPVVANDFGGPPGFELVTYPAELVPVVHVGTMAEPVEGLHVYYAETDERAEIASAPDPYTRTRCESGRPRSGVVRCSRVLFASRRDWIQPRNGATSNPLRC